MELRQSRRNAALQTKHGELAQEIPPLADTEFAVGADVGNRYVAIATPTERLRRMVEYSPEELEQWVDNDWNNWCALSDADKSTYTEQKEGNIALLYTIITRDECTAHRSRRSEYIILPRSTLNEIDTAAY